MEKNKRGNVKKAVWLPEELQEAVKKSAKEQKITFSHFVALALIDRLTVLENLAKIKNDLAASKEG